MIALSLLLLLPARPAAARPVEAPWQVVVAASPEQAAGNIKELTSRLYALQAKKDRSGYAAARLTLLENIAMLQEWCDRSPDPSSISASLDFKLTPEGRRALGIRKPRASDFVSTKAPKPAAGALDFKP